MKAPTPFLGSRQGGGGGGDPRRSPSGGGKSFLRLLLLLLLRFLLLLFLLILRTPRRSFYFGSLFPPRGDRGDSIISQRPALRRKNAPLWSTSEVDNVTRACAYTRG